jgi:YebC/PmpR family DNA-binding regulatory protein
MVDVNGDLSYNYPMSGHSKWATTHRQKEVKDAKRGAIFTKLAATITVAVRAGGGIGDPDKNFRLRLAVDHARQMNMPKENISRAIEKGMGTGGGEMHEATYEGFGPGGVAIMVDSLTDNKVRTVQLVKNVFDRNGGTMGNSGSVGYLFSQKGEIRAKAKPGKGVDEQELEIIDLGVDDLESEDGELIVYCDKDKTFVIKEAMEKLGYEVESAQLVMKPQSMTEVGDEETRKKLEALLEALEDLDDVTTVWANYA